MKRKWILTLIIFTIAVGCSTVLFAWWIHPYQLPKIDDHVTIDQYRLDFSDANQAVLKIQKFPKERKLELLMNAVRMNPDNLAYSNELRLTMSKDQREKDFISFISNINSPSYHLKLQEALAYVDKLQNKDLGTASLGQISAQSIEILNEILEKYPYDWLAHYARGLNNLYWPSGLRRTEKAIQDLSYCLAVAKKLENRPSPLWPLVYEAYGDALVKDGQIREGIAVWKEGADIYPEYPGFRSRSGVDKNQAYKIVKQERGIDSFQRPDPKVTDLSILWKS